MRKILMLARNTADGVMEVGFPEAHRRPAPRPLLPRGFYL
jgi:hypothetical protein